jgi:hypothetical protein
MKRIMATRKTPPTTRRSGAAQTVSESKGTSRSPAATTRTKRKTAPKKPVTAVPTERIRVRAYYLSLERNGCAADPIADWLRAERELTTESGKA